MHAHKSYDPKIQATVSSPPRSLPGSAMRLGPMFYSSGHYLTVRRYTGVTSQQCSVGSVGRMAGARGGGRRRDTRRKRDCDTVMMSSDSAHHVRHGATLHQTCT
eukprot:746000-Hanusia_phi.AAC.5